MKYMVDKKGREKVEKGWNRDLSALNIWENKIEKIKLSRLTPVEFVELWADIKEILLNFWTNILVPEMGNYGGDKLLEKELKKYLKDKKEISLAMEILTSPEEPSFYQQEEIDLSKTDDLKDHARRYFWLKNSYNGTEILDESFFSERKKLLRLDIEKKFLKRQKEIKEKKAEIIKKYKLPEEIVRMAEAFVRGIEWQDSRKAVIWRYLHYKDLMITEAAKRISVPKDDLLNFGTGEILEMLKGNKIDEKILKDRHIAFSTVMDVLKPMKVVDSKMALKYWDLYAEEKVKGNEKEIRGIVVSQSDKAVRGEVRVLLDPKKSDSFKEGEILVAPMTTPEYIFAMKKASAVITDVGGLMSHAAIVSRELGIPCIVGTKIATKVLKDGMMVEVDANEGIVKIINK